MIDHTHDLERIRDRLRCGKQGCECKRPRGNVHCPAHEDADPSLSLGVKDGQLLWRCFAGCSQTDVLNALRRQGLLPIPRPAKIPQTTNHQRPAPAERTDSGKPPAVGGLTLAQLAEAKRLPLEFLRSLGLREITRRGERVVAIPYFDEGGNEIAMRYRLALAGDRRFAWRRGDRTSCYGLERMADIRRAGWVLLVEGESDAWTAWHYGIPALGVPGKSCWRPEWAEALSGLEVFVWQEPDAEDFSARIAEDLPDARIIAAPSGIKDISDAHVAGHHVPALLERLKGSAVPAAIILQARRDAELAALEEAARTVLEADDPLELVEQELRRIGYGGDATPALIVYLCLTTRLLAMRHGSMPGHLLILGSPSVGKSYTLQSVLQLMPEEAYHAIDAGSPRALIYDDADLQHRAVIFSEIDSLPTGEDNPAASAIRALLQDHRLRYDATVRNPESGEYTVRHIDKPGPAVLVTTAVRPPGAQLASRMFVLHMPEEPERIRMALTTQAEIELSPQPGPDGRFVAFQAYLQRLAPIDVVVPFAPALAEAAASLQSAPRILRDQQRLFSLVKALALLRHRRRSRNADGRLVATIDDYATVFQLVGPMYEESLTGASRRLRDVVEAVRAIREAGEERVTLRTVARHIGLHPQTVSRIVRTAIREGWLVNREPPHRRALDLDVGEPLPERAGLPTPDEIADRWQGTGAGDADGPAGATPPPPEAPSLRADGAQGAFDLDDILDSLDDEPEVCWCGAEATGRDPEGRPSCDEHRLWYCQVCGGPSGIGRTICYRCLADQIDLNNPLP